ncbi:Arm DNA-binding domain-containing protein [Burkholderia singularis]|uniref:Arm DNA-binding domain-containing protein n=1 Tax=Burkholderia singularis TaxID=1503053 RepID=UPI001FDF78B0|nr:Arm DNA-binding domain-containing protein [Burkholderia singularis]
MRQAKAGNKPTKLTDGNGLYLLVKPAGSKLWRYRYRTWREGESLRDRGISGCQPPRRLRGARRCPRTR